MIYFFKNIPSFILPKKHIKNGINISSGSPKRAKKNNGLMRIFVKFAKNLPSKGRQGADGRAKIACLFRHFSALIAVFH
jgi:hypothetical protein